MSTLILRTATRFLVTLILLYSFFLLIRGHDQLGGGFVGGLVGAAAWALYGIAFGTARVRQQFTFNPAKATGAGILLTVGAGLLGTLRGEDFLKGQWIQFTFGNGENRELWLGSPLIFDLGVYLIIMGSVVNVIHHLEQENERWNP